MRTITIIMLFVFLAKNAFSQNFYYYKDEKIQLDLSKDKVLLKFKENTSYEVKRKSLSITSKIKPFEKKQTRGDFVFVELAENITEKEVNQILNELNKDLNIQYANRYYTYLDSIQLGLTNQFIVKLKESTSFAELVDLVENTQTVLYEQDKYNKSIYIISLDKKTYSNTLLMANYFYETKKFEFAEPNFISSIKLFTNDEFYSEQWAINNTGQSGGTSGADMKVEQAWGITTGGDEVKVAVVDGGVQLDHPDLVNNLLSGFDATGLGTNGGPINAASSHGTRIAGIIAAEANNSIGIAGVANGCSIIPVSLDVVNGSNIETAEAINWAWDDGEADVISCSWGLANPSLIVETAINNAVTMGRGGLGTIVLFAAGNENQSSVSYPASLATTIAIGATDMCDARLEPSPCDGSFHSGGSNRGSALDVMAPGYKIKTTDINSGYIDFGGTSAATPNAAGVVALMLSVNRCLSESDVRKILELSCDKPTFVSSWTDLPICYLTVSGRPNGTWNEEMGYGRINAYNAVRYSFSNEVKSYTNVTGTSQGENYCSESLCKREFLNGGCSEVSSGVYFVKWHRVEANVSYPFTFGAELIGSSNGVSFANPNNGDFFIGIYNVTPTSATIFTYVYESYNLHGQFIGWVPTSPNDVRFNYHLLSSVEQDLYFQNHIISTGTNMYSAMNKIEMGKDVTNILPTGDFIIEGDAKITFHAGEKGIMKPGTIIQPDTDGFFQMYVEPFFTCTQFQMGKKRRDDGNFSPVIKDYSVDKFEESDILNFSENIGGYLKNYPNPFTDNTTIEYKIDKSERVTITIYDDCGRPFYNLKNKSVHEAGVYQIKLTGIELSPGVYYCTLLTDSFMETKKLIVVN